jgi:hypothetical protein
MVMIPLVPQNMAHILQVNKCQVLKRASDPSNYFICGIFSNSNEIDKFGMLSHGAFLPCM